MQPVRYVLVHWVILSTVSGDRSIDRSIDVQRSDSVCLFPCAVGVASALPGVLASFARLSRSDAAATSANLSRVRASLESLRSDPLLNRAVERLEDQLKLLLSAYKRAIEAGATTAHLNVAQPSTLQPHSSPPLLLSSPLPAFPLTLGWLLCIPQVRTKPKRIAKVSRKSSKNEWKRRRKHSRN